MLQRRPRRSPKGLTRQDVSGRPRRPRTGHGGQPRNWPRGPMVNPRGETCRELPTAGSAAPRHRSGPAVPVRPGCSDRPCGQRPGLHQASTRGRCLSRGRRDHLCWRSRAASPDSLKQIRDVLCGLRPQYPPRDSSRCCDRRWPQHGSGCRDGVQGVCQKRWAKLIQRRRLETGASGVILVWRLARVCDAEPDRRGRWLCKSVRQL